MITQKELLIEDGTPAVSSANFRHICKNRRLQILTYDDSSVSSVFDDGTTYVAKGFRVGVPGEIYIDRIGEAQEVPDPMLLALAKLLTTKVGGLSVREWVTYLQSYPAAGGWVDLDVSG